MQNQKDFLIPEGGWLDLEYERVPVVPPEMRSLLLKILSRVARAFRRPDIPNIFLVFYSHPRLFWAWLFFASRLFPFGKLPARLRERIILRVAWQCRCRYEWVQHTELALSIGITKEEVVALTKDATAMGDAIKDPRDVLVIQACDQILKNKVIEPSTWIALSQHYSHKQLIEIIILVGHYDMLAAFLINMGTQIEPHLEEFIAGFSQRVKQNL